MELSSLHRNVKVRLLDVFINSLSTSMYLPFMGIYFATRFGSALTGIFMVFIVLFGFFAGLYAGYFADVIGRKKIILGAAFTRFVGILIMITSNLTFSHSSILTLFAILIISACEGITEPVAEAMVIDVTTNDNRKSVYTYMYWFVNLAVVIGAVVGGFLFTTHLLIILIISLVLSMISIIIIACFITDTYKSRTIDKSNSRFQILKDIVIQYKKVSLDTTFMLFTLATLLFFLLEFQTSNYIGIRLADELKLQNLLSLGTFDLKVDGTRMLGFLNAENTILVVATTLLIGKLVKRFNNVSVLTFGLLIYTVGYFILGFSNAPIILLIAGFIATIGEIMFWPVRQTYLAELIPENARSSYMAVNSLVVRGASVIASLFITVGTFVSPFTMSSLYIIIGLLSIWLFIISIRRISS